jgi:hypothetical protein
MDGIGKDSFQRPSKRNREQESEKARESKRVKKIK